MKFFVLFDHIFIPISISFPNRERESELISTQKVSASTKFEYCILHSRNRNDIYHLEAEKIASKKVSTLTQKRARKTTKKKNVHCVEIVWKRHYSRRQKGTAKFESETTCLSRTSGFDIYNDIFDLQPVLQLW